MRDENGQFEKGISGNPSGRPLGSRNKATLAMEALLIEDCEAITLKCIEEAKKGNMAAIKLVFERLYPISHAQRLEYDLPSVRSKADMTAAKEQVVQSVCRGTLDPEAGLVLMKLMKIRAMPDDISLADYWINVE